MSVLISGVFLCLNCSNKIRVEQTSEWVRAPVSCPKCGGRSFSLLAEESEFQDLDTFPDPTLNRILGLSQVWDNHLYGELLEKAMLEIESRAPLRRLSRARIKWEKRLGLRRGASC